MEEIEMEEIEIQEEVVFIEDPIGKPASFVEEKIDDGSFETFNDTGIKWFMNMFMKDVVAK